MTFDPAAQRWLVPPITTLTNSLDPSQVGELLSGALYIDAHSDAFPDAEIRGQVLLPTMSLVFGSLSGDQMVPRVSSQGSGIVSVFEDRSTQRFQINARTIGLNDVVSIGVYGEPGPAFQSRWLFFLRPDANGNMVASDNLWAPGL